MKTISQREARRLKKRVEELERDNRTKANAWADDWPGGIHVGTLAAHHHDWTALKTARRLGFALVATTSNTDQIAIYAVKP